MSLAPIIHNLAFLPVFTLREALSVFRAATDALGSDLALNQRLDAELRRLSRPSVATAPVSPQLITHLFEWRDQIDAFAASHAAADAPYAGRLRRLTETVSVLPLPSSAGLDRARRESRVDEGTATYRRIRSLFDVPVPAAAWPDTVWIDDETVPRGHAGPLEAGLKAVLGFRIPTDDFLNAFRVDVPGYRLDALFVETDHELDGARVLLTGVLMTDAGERAGSFQRALYRRPPPGGEWRAFAINYNPDGPVKPHIGRGVARRLHQRFLGFLHRLGVDRFYLTADQSGHYVWPHLGFRHRERAEFEAVKARFRHYLNDGGWWSAQTEARWAPLAEGWEIGDFELAGVAVGREFLLSLAGRTGQNLAFDVANLRDAGWERLFRGALTVGQLEHPLQGF